MEYSFVISIIRNSSLRLITLIAFIDTNTSIMKISEEVNSFRPLNIGDISNYRILGAQEII